MKPEIKTWIVFTTKNGETKNSYVLNASEMDIIIEELVLCIEKQILGEEGEEEK